MSTATAEKPKAETPKAESAPPTPQQFEMPKVRVGQQVRYYRHAEVNDQHPPEVAFVIKTGRRAISRLKTIDGFPRETVLHISDPRLTSTDARENGAWDYIEEELEQRKLNADLLARVAALEEALKKK